MSYSTFPSCRLGWRLNGAQVQPPGATRRVRYNSWNCQARKQSKSNCSLFSTCVRRIFKSSPSSFTTRNLQVNTRSEFHLVPWSWQMSSWPRWTQAQFGTTSFLGLPMWKTGTRMEWKCKLCEIVLLVIPCQRDPLGARKRWRWELPFGTHTEEPEPITHGVKSWLEMLHVHQEQGPKWDIALHTNKAQDHDYDGVNWWNN